MLQCRICFDEEYRFNLLKPCACSGTLEFVHRNCLLRWLQYRAENSPGDAEYCEICKHRLNVDISSLQPANTVRSIAAKRLYFILTVFALYLLFYILFTGKLKIVIHSGTLADADLWPFEKADGYVDVCLDGHCGCRTQVVTDSHEPRWNSVCSEWSNKSVFIFSKLTLMIYDADYDLYDDFLGQVDISIPWIIFSGLNGLPVNYTWNHPVHGSIFVSIKWIDGIRWSEHMRIFSSIFS